MQESMQALLGWGLGVSTLLFILYVCLISEHNRSVLVISCTVISINFFMMQIENPIKSIANRELLRFVWYNAFALCNLFIVMCIDLTHRINGMTLTRYAKTIKIHYMVLSFIQFFAYWDQLTFNSEFIHSLYSIGVPSIGFSVSIILGLAIFKDFIIQAVNSPELEEKQ